MMVTILRGPNGLVDLEAPIYAPPEQRQPIIEFLEQLVPDQADVLAVSDVAIEYEKSASEIRSWQPAELLMLLSDMSNKEVEARTERSPMSVLAKRGAFVQPFLHWMHGQGRVGVPTADDVRAFLEEARE